MKKLKIAHRLFLCFGLIVAMFLVAALFTMSQMRGITEGMEKLGSIAFPRSQAIETLLNAVNESKVQLRNYALAADESQLTRLGTQLDQAVTGFKNGQQALDASVREFGAGAEEK